MKIFKDAITGDEMFSDTFPIKLIDGIVYEVETKMVSKSTEENFNIGANPSQEGGEDEGGVDSQQVTVNNLVDSARLQSTVFDKKSYMAYIKSYMKKMLDKLKENDPQFDEKAWQAKMQTFVKGILEKFGDFSFYTGENMDIEGMIPLMFYKEDGITPYFYFFKDGLIEDAALRKDVHMNVPTAPELGLFLDECFFPAYNQKWQSTHEEVSLKGFEQQILDFKQKYIYKHIASTEVKEGVVALWLHSLNQRNYPDFIAAKESQKLQNGTESIIPSPKESMADTEVLTN